MAAENNSKPNNTTNAGKNKKRKQYLPHNKPVKKKGSYPLRPGVEGFFITCDGGRERQASHEAINVLDSFYEELIHGKDSSTKFSVATSKPMNKKIIFTDSSDEEDDNGAEDDTEEVADTNKNGSANDERSVKTSDQDDDLGHVTQEKGRVDDKADSTCLENQKNEAEEPPAKKQCLEADATQCQNAVGGQTEEKSIDKLIEAELQELGDKSRVDSHFQKRRFSSLDSGCNGVVFVQMRKKDMEPSTKEIVEHMLTSAASTRKHISRFILRVLPVEVTCYASEEEITRAMKPLVEQYFPVETETACKFAVLYEARANSGIDRMKIINAVAKSIPGPHKVDLGNPDKTIIVQIVKTICLLGVVEKYKELAKYNLRQLTSSKS
ncbi:THUMP domain [Dillenia turbinata]|uniref:THUMP domain n=1 Tax=Dillenia turbinata TaxID=194707 RepID=A0AAN8V2S7_9MAGN